MCGDCFSQMLFQKSSVSALGGSALAIFLHCSCYCTVDCFFEIRVFIVLVCASLVCFLSLATSIVTLCLAVPRASVMDIPLYFFNSKDRFLIVTPLVFQGGHWLYLAFLNRQIVCMGYSGSGDCNISSVLIISQLW